jgi:hypothetical protein
LLLAACAGDGTETGAGRLPYRTRVSDAKPGEAPAAAPGIVYVTDFEIDAGAVPPAETGVLPGRGPVRSVLGRLRGESPDPEAKARELVDRMANAIVEDLAAKHVPAQRLAADAPHPAQGWLVRGVFTELDEGNRIRKAVIGFGAGKSELELYVAFVDLARDPDHPFYSFDASNNSGNMPGGAVLKMNPYAIAARYVMSRNADTREIDHTAETIAAQLAERIAKAGTQQSRR